MSQNASLPTYSAIYAFGDSLSDAGNLSNRTSTVGATEPVTPPYFKQQYTHGTGNVFSNGPTWVQDLSIALGLGTLAPSVLGGTDFAYGGAETGSTPQDATELAIQAISLPTQITQFQASVPKPSANALYSVSIGANDLLDILSNTSLSAQQQTTDVTDAVANEVSFLNQLVAGGAKNLLVLNVPDLGKTPDVMQGLVNGSNTPSATLDATASQLASEYNSDLTSQIATITSAGKATVHVVDAYQLIDNAIANPASYGLTNVTSPVWSGNYTSGSSGTLTAVGAAAQEQNLFWDHLHPTETGHQAIADAAEAQLSGAPVLSVVDTTKAQVLTGTPQVYTGPAIGPLQQYINTSTDSLGITATTPDWFILGGSGDKSITVSGGTNILDGGTGSAFLTGGSGADSFYVDARSATANIWSTVADFHAGDAVTVWGVSSRDFTLSWLSGQGASGSTGLTLVASEAGKPLTAVTLASFTPADLTNGRLSVAYGTEAGSGSEYTYIHANS